MNTVYRPDDAHPSDTIVYFVNVLFERETLSLLLQTIKKAVQNKSVFNSSEFRVVEVKLDAFI